MSKHGKTHLCAHPEVDYAIVLDGGQVAAYFRNTTRKLMPIDTFEALFGKLEEYKPGTKIPHRPKTAFPVDVSISDQAYALLVKEAADAAAAAAPAKAAAEPREDETPTPPEGTPTPPDKPPTKDDDDRHGKGRRRSGLELDDK